jgi:2-phosphosulfolactate phosphatase
MQKIHVLTRKEELDGERLDGKVLIVLDVLFATTTMVAVLNAGLAEVIPMPDGPTALAEAQKRAPGSFLLAGEFMAETLPGFLHATPQSLMAESIAGRSLIYATTNGTPALLKSRGGHEVLAAALVNGRAVVEHVVRSHPDRTIVLVCAGSAGRFNLEDFYGAGYLVSLFQQSPGARSFTDAALAAGLLYTQGRCPPGEEHHLWRARVGQRMLGKGLDAELHYAAQESVIDAVPRLVGDRLVLG